MAYIVQNEIHVATEIIDLYYAIVNKEEADKLPSKLPQYGIDEERFKKVELRPIYKYIDTFKSKSPYGEDESIKMYFRDIHENLNSTSLATILLENKEIEELKDYREEILRMDEEILRQRIAWNIAAELEDDMQTKEASLLVDSTRRVEYLKNQPITIEAKWNIVLLLDHAKEHMLQIIKIILESQSAYETASKHILKLKEKFVKEIKSKLENNPNYISESLGININGVEEIKLYPSIVSYGSGRLRAYNEREGVIFFGCYMDYISELAKKNSTEKIEIVNILKLLGESSKFEIIKLLKKKPMYGIEIAESLGITPPTVSHHMNNLMIYKLVRLEKIENKFCYVLNKEKIVSILKQLQNQLLE